MTTTDQLLTVEEAAAQLGVSRQRVSQLLDKGKLPMVRQQGFVAMVPASAVAERRRQVRSGELYRPTPPPGFLTTQQVAEMCGRSETAVRGWIRDGKLTGHPQPGRGRWVMIAEADARAFSTNMPRRGRPRTSETDQ